MDGEKKGSLIVVGSGIQAIRHFTWETLIVIEKADKVLYLVADPISESWIKEKRPDAETLKDCYSEEKKRIISYLEMTSRTMKYVRKGLDVCVIYYGHPGIFVYPSHESIKLARHEGYTAYMLPGISAEDCLFADIDYDPGSIGCQSFEATDFIIANRKVDTTSGLILWQIGVIGDIGYSPQTSFNERGLKVLISVLKEHYDPNHEVIVYECNHFVVCKPIVVHTTIEKLMEAPITPISTLFIPPQTKAKLDENRLSLLGLARSELGITQEVIKSYYRPTAK